VKYEVAWPTRSTQENPLKLTKVRSQAYSLGMDEKRSQTTESTDQPPGQPAAAERRLARRREESESVGTRTVRARGVGAQATGAMSVGALAVAARDDPLPFVTAGHGRGARDRLMVAPARGQRGGHRAEEDQSRHEPALTVAH